MAAEQDPEGRAAARPLLTDFYQATMALGYWRAGRAREAAEFELFFRRCPFGGAFALAAGLRDCVRFLRTFRLRDAGSPARATEAPTPGPPHADGSPHPRNPPCPKGLRVTSGLSAVTGFNWFPDVQFLASVLPLDTDPAFFEHLRALDCSEVTVRALPEGSLAFPGVPLLQVSGPLLVVQLLETPLLCLVSYARWAAGRRAGDGPQRGVLRGTAAAALAAQGLVATNAARLRLIAGPEKRLLEMGLRRAQGPDGGLTASTYSYLGGFDSSSNVLAGQLRGVPVAGTLAHSFVTSFSGSELPPDPMLAPAAGEGPGVDLAAKAQAWLERVCAHLGLGVQEPHPGERAAFVAYALAFPRAFQGLLDSYSVRRSGLPNFLAVSLALGELGYQAVGVRLDSGDLLQQAREIRQVFRTVAAQFQVPWLESVPIAVSNNIDEEGLVQLAQEGSEVNVIGIGTSVVTCPQQPSLGCVYKVGTVSVAQVGAGVRDGEGWGMRTSQLNTFSSQLVAVGGQPRMKLTEDPEKQTLPGSKAAFRLLGSDGERLPSPHCPPSRHRAPLILDPTLTGSLLMDVLQLAEEPVPQAGQELRVWPRGAQEPCTVRPARVQPLLRLCLQQGQLCEPLPSLAESRALAQLSLSQLSPAHRRLRSPAQYQVGACPPWCPALGALTPPHPPLPSSAPCRWRCRRGCRPWWTVGVWRRPPESSSGAAWKQHESLANPTACPVSLFTWPPGFPGWAGVGNLSWRSRRVCIPGKALVLLGWEAALR
ncbi:Nicotinate phosphoribosyltransferase [Plecturocebus cupreus]